MPLIDLIGGIGMVSIAGTLRAPPAYLALARATGAVLALALILIATARSQRRWALRSANWPRSSPGTRPWRRSLRLSLGYRWASWSAASCGRCSRNVNTVPDPTVPFWSVVLTGLGALLFANLVGGATRRVRPRRWCRAPSNYERPAIRPMRRYNLASSFLG